MNILKHATEAPCSIIHSESGNESEEAMTTACAKCGAEMVDGRIPSPLKYLFGFKADDQKHFSLETNIQKARACSGCGYVELFLDPQELEARRT